MSHALGRARCEHADCEDAGAEDPEVSAMAMMAVPSVCGGFRCSQRKPPQTAPLALGGGATGSGWWRQSVVAPLALGVSDIFYGARALDR